MLLIPINISSNLHNNTGYFKEDKRLQAKFILYIRTAKNINYNPLITCIK